MATSLFFIITTFLSMRMMFALEDKEEIFTFLQCPTISNGFYPYCECKYGPKYDEETNTCPNPECPVNNSTGTYPDCTCLHENFDYSVYINECFRVCPENSTGYWPDCSCDTNEYVFDKSRFECIKCPDDSSGRYPNCTCDDNDGPYNDNENVCEKCEGGSVGTYPNCVCIENDTYDAYNGHCVNSSNGCPYDYDASKDEDNKFCLQCPFSSVGVYPNCICEGNSTYEKLFNYCSFGTQCPFNSIGVYPDCICETNETYIMELNSCFVCPGESTGEYPDCVCDTYPLQYVKETNICEGCPSNSTGIYPDCTCQNGLYSKVHKICIECPVNSIGLYPKCECEEKDFIFSAFINECYIMCPDNSSGVHPFCDCYDGNYYDEDEFTCKSNVGRKCPLDSIGIGPNCLCVREIKTFSSSSWSCIEKSPVGVAGGGFSSAGISNFCPNDSGKWPQCDASIDQNVLKTLIG